MSAQILHFFSTLCAELKNTFVFYYSVVHYAFSIVCYFSNTLCLFCVFYMQYITESNESKDEGSIPVRLLDLIISITARLAKVFNDQVPFVQFHESRSGV